MTTFHVEAQISPEQLLKVVDQMDHADLEEFVSRVLSLRAQRRAPSLPQVEADLLQRIGQGIPIPIRERHEALAAKRDAQNLTPEEHIELLRLTDEIEDLQAQRVSNLVQLARLRGVPLANLMETLGVRTAHHE